MDKSRQQAQVLYLGLFVAIIAITSLYLLYHSTRLSTEKTRVVNAADAAALSGGVWVARQLNFAAYTNRAMVVNTYFQGHYTAWVSHIRMIQEGIEKLAELTSGIPVVGQIMGAIDKVTDAFQWFVEIVGIPVIGTIELGNTLLVSNQYIATYGLTGEAEDIMEQVADAHAERGASIQVYGPNTDPDGSLPDDSYSGFDRTRVAEAEDLQTFTEVYRPGFDAGRFSNLVNGTISAMGNSDQEEDVRQYNWVSSRPHPDLAFPNIAVPTDPLSALDDAKEFLVGIVGAYLAAAALPPPFSFIVQELVDDFPKPEVGDLLSTGGSSSTDLKLGNFNHWKTEDGGLFGFEEASDALGITREAVSTEFGLLKQAALGYVALNGLKVGGTGATGDFLTDLGVGNVQNYLTPALEDAGVSPPTQPNEGLNRQLVLSLIARSKLAESLHDLSDGQRIQSGDPGKFLYASARVVVFYQDPADVDGSKDCTPANVNSARGLRPDHPDCYANLFNPYWMARLEEGPFDVLSIEPVAADDVELMPYSKPVPGTTR